VFQPLQALAGDRHRKIQAAGGRTDRALVEYPQEKDEVAHAVHDFQYFIEID
jgi:hypothetical protein